MKVRLRLEMLAGYLAAYGLLCCGLLTIVEPRVGDIGFGIEIVPGRIAWCIAAISAACLLLPIEVRRLSQIFLHLQFALPVLPMLVIYSMAQGSQIYTAMAVGAFFLLASIAQLPHALMSVANSGPPETSKAADQARVQPPSPIEKRSADSIVFYVLLVSIMAYISLVVAISGFKHFNINLEAVYDFRDDAAFALPGAFDYITPIISNTVMPLAFAIAVHRRMVLMGALTFVLAFLIFGLTSHKAPIYAPIYVIAVYFALDSRHRLQMLFGIHVAFMVVSFAVASTSWAGETAALAVLRRFYLIPAHLNFVYYEFFSTNPHVHWATSKLTLGLVENVYGQGIPSVIGQEWYQVADMHANTGWLGAGYAHYGLPGMLIYAFAMAGMFWWADAVSANRSVPLAGSALAIPMLTAFMATDLPVTFLSHGVLLGLLILPLLGRVETPAHSPAQPPHSKDEPADANRIPS